MALPLVELLRDKSGVPLTSIGAVVPRMCTGLAPCILLLLLLLLLLHLLLLLGLLLVVA